MEEESPQAPLASVFTINAQLTPLINVIVFISHKSNLTAVHSNKWCAKIATKYVLRILAQS